MVRLGHLDNTEYVPRVRSVVLIISAKSLCHVMKHLYRFPGSGHGHFGRTVLMTTHDCVFVKFTSDFFFIRRSSILHSPLKKGVCFFLAIVHESLSLPLQNV